MQVILQVFPQDMCSIKVPARLIAGRWGSLNSISSSLPLHDCTFTGCSLAKLACHHIVSMYGGTLVRTAPSSGLLVRTNFCMCLVIPNFSKISRPCFQLTIILVHCPYSKLILLSWSTPSYDMHTVTTIMIAMLSMCRQAHAEDGMFEASRQNRIR